MTNLLTSRPYPSRPLVLLLGALLSFASTTVAQEENPEEKTLTEEFFDDHDLARELTELFHEVEAALVEIDDRLADAGAGSRGLGGAEESGLEKLLRSTEEKSKSVVEGIDRILEVASQMQSSSSGSGSSSSEPSSGESPLDAQRDRGPQDRERTPEAPEQQGQEPRGQEPQQEEDQKPGEGQKPRDGDANQRDGRNEKGDPPAAKEGQAAGRQEDADRWGELPQRVRETFRNQGRGDLPVQYRDWIDAYYRRLNQNR